MKNTGAITIIVHHDGPGTEHTVTVIRGYDPRTVHERGREKYDQFIRETLTAYGIEDRDKVVVGYDLGNYWHPLTKQHPFDLPEFDRVEWKYRDSTDSVTITVLPTNIVEEIIVS